MKRIIIAVFFVLIILSTRAQISVAVVPFTPGKLGDNTAMMQEEVIAGLVEAKRFSIVSTEDWGIDETAPEQSILEASLPKAKASGASYLITGKVTRATVMWFGGGGCGADILFTVKVFDVSTGQFYATKEFKYQDLFTSNPNEKAAMERYKPKVVNGVKEWTVVAFPKQIEMVRITKSDDRHGATRAMISTGTDDKSKNNDQFKIVEYVNENVGGKMIPRTVQLGIGEIMFVDDANFSTMDIKRGGRDVADKIAAGVKLYLVPLK